jgi:hypothetical protein
MGLAVCKDCRVDTATKFIRKLVEFGIPIDLNGALGGVANDVAVMAPL